MIGDEILRYYETHYDESARLGRGQGLLEFLRTTRIIERTLGTDLDVADIGGGPGVYAAWLAEMGHAVTVIEPVDRHLRAVENLHRSRGTVTAIAGDARRVELLDESVDLVLLLGPLYHLPEATDRAQALAEVHRILRPGGRVFAAAISRFAAVHDGLTNGWLYDDPDATLAELDHGQHRSPDGPGGFTTAYFQLPEDLGHEVEAAGFADVSLYGIEGIPGWTSDLDARLADPTQREILLTALDRLESEPSLVGASAHVLAAGVKPR